MGTKDSIITILVANYNIKNGSSSSSNNNTTTYLATHDFNLLYSRRLRPKPNDNDDNEDGEEEEEEEFIATLISITPSSGILEAKIEPSASRGGGGGGGQTHEEAFAAFKRYVEGILGEVLKSVPDAVPDVTTASSSPSEITIEQQQPPPAYEVRRNALFIEGGGGVGKF